MLKEIVNYLKNNRIDCHADKSARNGRVSHYGVFALCRTKQFAFTLAETLIVMGIIGVVAALTLPNLNSSTGEKEKVAKVKKIYQNLNDAFGRAEVVYGPFNEWCVNYSGSCVERHMGRFLDFLKVSKKCNSGYECSLKIARASYYNSAVLADGSTIGYMCINANFKNCSFTIDIDGINKGSNKEGFDVFEFRVSHENGVYTTPVLSSNKYVIKTPKNLIVNYDSFDPMDAAYWVVNFGNMDYLKTSDGTTCPDGVTKLTFGGNHTCK